MYLTQATGKVDYTYDALARAVLHGRYPSQDSNLQLQAVTVDGNGVATVSLKPLPAGHDRHHGRAAGPFVHLPGRL